MKSRLLAAALVVIATTSASRSARADDAAPADASASDAGAAQREYTLGRESYAAGLYGRSLAAFERSLALLPSPNTRLYVARSLRELGRWGESAEAMRVTIREAEERGGKYLATRDAATTELEDVLARMERAAPPAPAPAPAPLVTSPPPAVASAPPPSLHVSDTRAMISPLTWTSGAVAFAAAASSGVLYALGSDRFAFLEANCVSTRDAACDAARSTGRTEETAAYVALGVATVAAATAIVSWTIDRRASSAAHVKEARSAWPLRF